MAGRQSQLRAGRLRRLRATLALSLLGLGVLATPGGARLASEGSGTPALAGRSPAVPLGGINVAGLGYGSRISDAGQDVAQAASLHAKLLRTTVPWSVLEPAGPNRLDPHAVAYVDQLASAARAAKIRLILVLDSSPCWASSAPAAILRTCTTDHFGAANTWPPRDPSAYAEVAAYLARRYGSALAAIEVWNEPDQSNQFYFGGPHKPQRYAGILKAAYPAIKRANANVQVLAGSLVGSNGVFLRDLYAAGIKGFFDGLAVHFYKLVLGSVRAIHEVQLANGDAKPLWLDEFGWSTCYPQHSIQEEQACVTTQTQGPDLTDVFRSLRATPWIAAEVVYNMQDSQTENFGVLSASSARKPSFGALARVLTSPFGSPRPVMLSLSREAKQIVAAGSGPVGDYMELEAFAGGVLRYQALFILDRFNRFSIKLPRVLGTKGLEVQVYQYWAGVGRAAHRGI